VEVVNGLPWEIPRWWLTAGYHLLTLLFLTFTVFYGWLALR
jgi:hypothetical protein